VVLGSVNSARNELRGGLPRPKLEKSVKNTPKLTAERLREMLHYDPETGVFTSKSHRTSNATAGKVAGWVRPNGYRQISVDGFRYRAHRLAWVYMTGGWPQDDVDHINRFRDDNRWVNLRAATRGENLQNASLSHRNVSGCKGVTPHPKSAGRWVVHIRVNNKHMYLGSFGDLGAAIAVRKAAETRLHPFAVKEVVHGE
jgi:hypothetical protein